MSFAINNSGFVAPGTSGASATVTISIAAGHHVVVAGNCFGGSGTFGTVTDSGGNTYSVGSSATDGLPE